ncbi:MAG TPA: hypothetical protein VF148_11750 [Acidimicrobiia bacterium]
MTAATAGALGLLGATLGIGVANLGFAAAYSGDLTPLLPVPFTHLQMIVTGLPATAAGSGWLLAGSEPTSLARRPLE